MKNIKLFICLSLLLSMLVGCSSQTESATQQIDSTVSYEVTDFTEMISAGEVKEARAAASFENELTPEYLLDNSDIVVLGSVVSIDYSTMDYNWVTGHTFGDILVQDVFYGDSNLKETVIPFVKVGATMVSRSEYQEAQPETLRNKLQRLNRESGNTNEDVYYNLYLDMDIPIEAGKTYLIYLKYVDDLSSYEIIGLQNGLREVNVPASNSIMLMNGENSNLSIKDNNTGNWENLNTYLDTYVR